VRAYEAREYVWGLKMYAKGQGAEKDFVEAYVLAEAKRRLSDE